MRLAKMLEHLRGIAPEHLAEPWDKVGLQIGDLEQHVRRGLLCIDLTEPVLAEAVADRVDLIVAYHPPIFEPMANFRGEDWKGRLVRDVIRRGIAVYSSHTALDAAPDGLNDWLAQSVGDGTVKPIQATLGNGLDARFKIVTFIPPDQANVVRTHLAAAGAGQIGDYSKCSFNVEGVGTFYGGDSTRPTIGRRGRVEHVGEIRLEMICPVSDLAAVIETLRRVHPYEEPAFDVYPLSLPPAAGLERAGQGRVVELASAMSLNSLVDRISRRLGSTTLRVAVPPKRRRGVRRLGLCAGAGGSLLREAGAIDTFFTGEMRHHDVLDAVQRGITVILAGHTQTERPFLAEYRRRLIRRGGTGVSWRISRSDRAVLKSVKRDG